MARLAVIPARGGSKRIPGKNVRPFLGVPALVRVLETVKASGLFDVIHVSTDDDAIADIARQAGFAPDFARPDALSDDHAPIRAAASHSVREYAARGQSFDTIALVYATAVLLTPKDLIEACRQFEADRDRHPLVSVVDIGTPIEKLFYEQDGVLTTPAPDQFAERTQDLHPALSDAGAFCFYTGKSLIADGAGDQLLAFKPFRLARTHAVDIDTMADWAFAEALYTAREQTKA